ncbi:MAG: Hsp20/alpha crystallin family protein [Alphaproteobacteria bacterium]|nr:Hsp20/alpha crystallin family protein [Alphaproteobacteria bacterium]
MDITPWRSRGRNDLFPLRSLQREMDRLFEGFFAGSGVPERGEAFLSPALDVTESDNAVHIAVDLPGMSEKEVEVSVSDGILTISGERKTEKDEKKKHYHLIERSYGKFVRSLTLPNDVDAEKVEAVFKNGVLDITVPKRPEAKKASKKIEVKKT